MYIHRAARVQKHTKWKSTSVRHHVSCSSEGCPPTPLSFDSLSLSSSLHPLCFYATHRISRLSPFSSCNYGGGQHLLIHWCKSSLSSLSSFLFWCSVCVCVYLERRGVIPWSEQHFLKTWKLKQKGEKNIVLRSLLLSLLPIQLLPDLNLGRRVCVCFSLSHLEVTDCWRRPLSLSLPRWK